MPINNPLESIFEGKKGIKEESLNDYRQDDGTPLHFALFNIPDNGLIDNDVAREAKLRLETIFSYNPEFIRKCNNMPPEIVRSIIKEAEQEMRNEEEMAA